MNKGFILYEALIMLGIVSFILISSISLNHQTIINNQSIEKKINKLEKQRNTNQGDCDFKCLIKKASLP